MAPNFKGRRLEGPETLFRHLKENTVAQEGCVCPMCSEQREIEGHGKTLVVTGYFFKKYVENEAATASR